MSRKSSIQYNPKLTVKENAFLNNVSISGIYYYIRNHSVNREEDRANNLIDKITHAIKDNPEASPFKISKITGLHLATVKKYWDYAESGKELKSEALCSPYRKPSLKELECFYTTDQSVPFDLLRHEQFGEQILDPYCSVGVIAEVLKSSGYKVYASDIQERGYGNKADFHKTEWESEKYDIVSIPPTDYNLFQTIIRCVEVAKNKVALLLPLDMIAGVERYNRLFDYYPPTKIYAYLEPISFYRDSVERIISKKGYGWFIWDKEAEKGTTLTWIHNEHFAPTDVKVAESSTHYDERIKGIIGAVIGDIAGSTHEFKKRIKRDVQLFTTQSAFTDDTVLTVAIADAILHEKPFNQALWNWGNLYPHAGYGGSFADWLKGSVEVQKDSIANGGAMRVCAVGYAAKTLEEALSLAKKSATPTHNSREGIKGAQSVAAAIFLAKNGATKTEIIDFIKEKFKYKIFETKEDVIRFIDNPLNGNMVFAKNTIPIALSAFYQGDNYEDVVRTAISYGSDTDTFACIAGSICGAFYGVPRVIAEQAAQYLPKDLLEIINEFDGNYLPNNRTTPPTLRHNGINSIVVYGANIDDTIKGERGREITRKSASCYHPLKGFPIRTINTPLEVVMEDVYNLIKAVNDNPDKFFYIHDVGIGKSNRGIGLMARLFEPLKDKDNVYLWKDFWDYYNSYQK